MDNECDGEGEGERESEMARARVMATRGNTSGETEETERKLLWGGVEGF